MRVTTTDPRTLHDVADTDNAPYLIEVQGSDAVKIYFESEESRAEYLAICGQATNPVEAPAECPSAVVHDTITRRSE